MMNLTRSKELNQFYRCTQNAPLMCHKSLETVTTISGAKFCLECGFPTPILAQSEIRGNLGTYRVSEVIREQGLGRLYHATQIGKGHSVILKEYLLPKHCFNDVEIQQRRAALLQLTKATLSTSKSAEFRVINPLEAIADPSSDRVYLVFPDHLAATPTLSHALHETGAFSASVVRQILNQALQTLHFLHSSPVGMTNSAHGNLSLESLLRREDGYLYLCDRSCWEQLFLPTARETSATTHQDLVDLGFIAFSLWTGQATSETSNGALNPQDGKDWPQDDPPLKDFVCRLLGLKMPFESALAGRQALLNLPQPDLESGSRIQSPAATQSKPKFRKYWLLSLLALPLLGGLLWLLIPRLMPKSYAETREFKHLLPAFNDVNELQPGNYPYTGEALGTWPIILDKRPIDERRVRELLSQPRSDITAKFGYRLHAPKQSPLDEVLTKNSQANFAITSLVTSLPEHFLQETIAYDGLLVYVPAYKSQDLPSALQGQITVEQLQQIFTGKITRWKQLGDQFPDLPITPSRPTEPEALRLFKSRVLKNDPNLIARFNQIRQRSTFTTLRAIAAGERKTQTVEAGSISFGLLAQTWDQCKVYPLAVAQKNAAPVQPLLKETTNGTLQPVSPSDNLCFEKKPLPNLSAFTTAQYFLGVPLVVAYPRDNNLPGHRSGPLFAKLLKTQEGQKLLQQVGLVPLQTTPQSF
jgi:serine/threonine protein kinase